MITDDDLIPFEFADFFDEDSDADAVPSSTSDCVDPDYIDRHIARIPTHGDDSRWWLATHLNMFDDLSIDGSLTPSQREAVDNFALGYQFPSDGECVATQWDFPESQYIAYGCDVDTALELSESWRRGEYLPIMGHPADAISSKLNKMTHQPTPVEK